MPTSVTIDAEQLASLIAKFDELIAKLNELIAAIQAQ